MQDGVARELWLEHLERVMRLSETRSAALDAADREDIARELGISEADLQAAREEADDHLTRGHGYLQRGMYDEAISELTDALALDPSRLDIMLALARAHLRRHASGSEADAAEVKRYARFALTRDPDNEDAFAILEELRSLDTRRSAARRRIAIVAAGAALAGIAAWWLASGSPDTENVAEALARPTDAPEPGNDGCPPGTALEPGKGCVLSVVTITPGVGVGDIVIGESTPEDVLARYGADAKIDHAEHDGKIWRISYIYDENGTYAPGRAVNRSRPSQFFFRDGTLHEIAIGPNCDALQTSGGVGVDGSTKAEMLKELGEAYELIHPGGGSDLYRYTTLGIELTVVAQGEVIAIRLFRPGYP